MNVTPIELTQEEWDYLYGNTHYDDAPAALSIHRKLMLAKPVHLPEARKPYECLCVCEVESHYGGNAAYPSLGIASHEYEASNVWRVPREEDPSAECDRVGAERTEALPAVDSVLWPTSGDALGATWDELAAAAHVQYSGQYVAPQDFLEEASK